jgi:hypothetical protein
VTNGTALIGRLIVGVIVVAAIGVGVFLLVQQRNLQAENERRELLLRRLLTGSAAAH